MDDLDEGDEEFLKSIVRPSLKRDIEGSLRDLNDALDEITGVKKGRGWRASMTRQVSSRFGQNQSSSSSFGNRSSLEDISEMERDREKFSVRISDIDTNISLRELQAELESANFGLESHNDGPTHDAPRLSGASSVGVQDVDIDDLDPTGSTHNQDTGISPDEGDIPSSDPTSKKKKRSMFSRLFGKKENPVEEEKKRLSNIVVRNMKQYDSSFSEETLYREEKKQKRFVKRKEEEMVKAEEEKKKAEAERKKKAAARRRKRPWWERVAGGILRFFLSSLDAEKRRQEENLLNEANLLEDLKMTEEDVQRERETQALLVDMKKRELERSKRLSESSSLSSLELEKRRNSELLAQKLPKNMVRQGAMVQEYLIRKSLSGNKAQKMSIPLDVQKQMQEELLVEMADGVDENVLRRGKEVQQALIEYSVVKTKRQSGWFGFGKKSSTPKAKQEYSESSETEDASKTEESQELSENSKETERSETVKSQGDRGMMAASGWWNSWSGHAEEKPEPFTDMGPEHNSLGDFTSVETQKVGRASWLSLSMMTSDHLRFSWQGASEIDSEIIAEGENEDEYEFGS